MFWTFALIALLAICAFGWLNQWICKTAIIMWLVNHGKMPTDKELGEYVMLAWKKALGNK